MPDYHYLQVSPPSRRYRPELVVFVPLVDIDLNNHPWHERLLKGESINHEDVFNNRIANTKMEDYGPNEEVANNAVHSEVSQELVDLLNMLIPWGEFPTDSEFCLNETNGLDLDEPVTLPSFVTGEYYDYGQRDAVGIPTDTNL